MKQVVDYCIDYTDYNAFYNEDESHDYFCCVTDNQKLYSTKIQGTLKKAYATEKNRRWICLVFEFIGTYINAKGPHSCTLFLDPENRNTFRLLAALEPYKRQLLGKRFTIRTNKNGIVAIIKGKAVSLNDNFNIGKPSYERALQMLQGLVLVPERKKADGPDTYTADEIAFLIEQDAKYEKKTNTKEHLIDILMTHILTRYGDEIRKNGLNPAKKEDLMNYFKNAH